MGKVGSLVKNSSTRFSHPNVFAVEDRPEDSCEIRIELLEVILNGINRLGVNLADARLC